jgi:ATP-dependent DNA helicase PIF1
MRQTQALRVMLDGESVFLTGAPGAGKTYVLNEFIHRATKLGKTVAVTASTGIAATHIGGTTIHSWSGLGIRDRLNEYDRQWLKANDKLRKRYNAADVLVIDEISMLHGARLDMVNEACKILRDSDRPFGGLQVILVGDLFQLPPVTRGSELLDFAHTSAAWHELAPKICYITEQHRQAGDALLDVLEAMRRGQLEDVHAEALQERLGQKPDESAPVTRLYAHNIDVESINQKHLAAISSDTKLYTMQTKGTAAKVEQLTKSVLAPEKLELKIGAEVMFVANNFAAGFVNGSRGQVVQFSDGMPLVKLLATSRIIKVELHNWSLVEDDRKKAEVSQLPLRLAWAITIHKSQGMSLDAAEIDLSKSFTPGMGYVALSRVRSLQGVYLTGINHVALQLNPTIYDFDRQLQKASNTLAEQTLDVAEEIAPLSESEPETEPIEYDKELFEKLKTWRLSRAANDGVPAYVVAHNTTLEALAARRPTTAQRLMGIKGFGPGKHTKYGDDVLKIILDHLPEEARVAQADEQPQAETQAAIPREEKTAALKAEYPRSGKRWTPEEDAQLLKAFKAHESLNKVCETLERSPGSLWVKLAQLLEKES